MDAAPLTDPELDGPETTTFAGYIDGDQVGSGTLVLKNDSRTSLVQEIEGEAFDRLEGWVTTSFKRKGGELLAEKQTIQLQHKGELTFFEEKSFRDVQVPQLGGELSAYPRAMVPAGGLAVALRTLPWKEKARFLPPVWLTAIVHWPIDIRVEKREQITVPAGTFDAWRIRLRPSLVDVAQSLDELSSTLVPPVFAHVTVDSSRLVRLSFPTGPAKADPPGLLEALELS
jgi:hypothetical protein